MTGEKSDIGTFVLEFYSLSPPTRSIMSFGTPCMSIIIFYLFET